MRLIKQQAIVIANENGEILCSGIKRDPYLNYWELPKDGEVPDGAFLFSDVDAAASEIAKGREVQTGNPEQERFPDMKTAKVSTDYWYEQSVFN